MEQPDFRVDRVEEQPDTRVQPAPAPGLQIEQARVPGQHLQIVHPAEQVLHALQLANRAERPDRSQFPHQLERVAELLRGDADAVKPARRVQAAGRLNRLFDTCGPTRDPPAECSCPRRIRRRRVEIDGQLEDLPLNLLQIRALEAADHRLAADLTLPPDDPAHGGGRAGKSGPGCRHVVEMGERDVEFAHAAQRPRHTAQRPADPAPGRRPHGLRFLR